MHTSGRWEFRILARERNISLVHKVQTVSGVHSSSYLNGTGVLGREYSDRGVKVTIKPPVLLMSRMGGTMHLLRPT